MFPGGMSPKDWFTRQDVLLENFPHAVAFRSLDEEFYRFSAVLVESLSASAARRS
jgi:hypothetical protein